MDSLDSRAALRSSLGSSGRRSFHHRLQRLVDKHVGQGNVQAGAGQSGAQGSSAVAGGAAVGSRVAAGAAGRGAGAEQLQAGSCSGIAGESSSSSIGGGGSGGSQVRPGLARLQCVVGAAGREGVDVKGHAEQPAA